MRKSKRRIRIKEEPEARNPWYVERRIELKNEKNPNPVPVGSPSHPPAQVSEDATSMLKLDLPSKTTIRLAPLQSCSSQQQSRNESLS